MGRHHHHREEEEGGCCKWFGDLGCCAKAVLIIGHIFSITGGAAFAIYYILWLKHYSYALGKEDDGSFTVSYFSQKKQKIKKTKKFSCSRM